MLANCHPTTPSSVSLLPIPLALSCRTLYVLSLLVSSEDGVGVGGGDDLWAEQGSQA